MDVSLRLSVAQTGLSNITQLISQLQAAGQSTTQFEAEAERLRNEITQLGQQQAAISSFTQLRGAVTQSASALQQAQAHAQALGSAYRQLAAPTAAQTQAFQQARNAVNAAAAAHQANVLALQNQRAAMAQLGLNTTNLAQHQVNLNRASAAAAASQAALTQALNQAIPATQNNAAAAQQATAAWGSLRSGLAAGVGFAAAQVGLNSLSGALNKLKSGVEAVVSTGATFETLRVQLETLYQSSAKADTALAWITEFTAQTPFELGQVTQSFIKLKAMGVDPMDGSFQAIADQASALGASGETLSGIVLGLGQAWSKQKLQGEEALQLIERGVPVWEMLSRATGKNAAELQDMSAKGLLGRDAIKALMDEMGRSNMGAAEKAMQTFNGQVANAADNWTAFLRKIADAGTLDFFKEQIESVNAAFAELKATGKLDEYAKQASDAIVSMGTALRDTSVFIVQHADALLLLAQVAAGLKLTSVATQLVTMGVQATASASQMQAATSAIQKAFAVLNAALVGWAAGTYLKNQFIEVELAGIALAQGLTSLAARAKYAFDVLKTPINSQTLAEVSRLSQQLELDLQKISNEYAEMAEAAQKARAPMVETPKAAAVAIDAMTQELDAAIKAEQELEVAAVATAKKVAEAAKEMEAEYKKFGITSVESLRAVADESAALYKKLVDAKAPVFELNQAFEKMAEARLKLAAAAGDAALKEETAALRAKAATDEQRAALEKLTAAYPTLKNTYDANNPWTSQSADMERITKEMEALAGYPVVLPTPDNSGFKQAVEESKQVFDDLVSEIANADSRMNLAGLGSKLKSALDEGTISAEQYSKGLDTLNNKTVEVERNTDRVTTSVGELAKKMGVATGYTEAFGQKYVELAQQINNASISTEGQMRGFWSSIEKQAAEYANQLAHIDAQTAKLGNTSANTLIEKRARLLELTGQETAAAEMREKAQLREIERTIELTRLEIGRAQIVGDDAALAAAEAKLNITREDFELTKKILAAEKEREKIDAKKAANNTTTRSTPGGGIQPSTETTKVVEVRFGSSNVRVLAGDEDKLLTAIKNAGLSA